GREGEGQAVAVFGAVERDPVTIDGVGAALAKAAAFHLTVVRFHRGDRWKLVEFRVAGLAGILLGEEVAVGPVQGGGRRARVLSGLRGRLPGAVRRNGQRCFSRYGLLQRPDLFDERLRLGVLLETRVRRGEGRPQRCQVGQGGGGEPGPRLAGAPDALGVAVSETGRAGRGILGRLPQPPPLLLGQRAKTTRISEEDV